MDILNDLIQISVGMCSAVLTYWFHLRFQVTPVFASALVALVISGLSLLLPESQSLLAQSIPFVAIGGTFVGMSTRKKMKKVGYVLFAGLIFGLIFTRSSSLFEGFGGALGTSACVSVLGVIGIRRLFQRSKVVVKKEKIRKSNGLDLDSKL